MTRYELYNTIKLLQRNIYNRKKECDTEQKKIQFLSEHEVVEQLKKSQRFHLFENLSSRAQKDFMDFCTGKTMLPLTYDKIFKRIFNYERTPKRLEHFLSAILGFEVEILKVLPVESEKMNEAGSILVMDILVKTKEGMLIDVEMQRLPYLFNGKRVSCYLSDLIMRQYNRICAQVREEEKGRLSLTLDWKKNFWKIFTT